MVNQWIRISVFTVLFLVALFSFTKGEVPIQFEVVEKEDVSLAVQRELENQSLEERFSVFHESGHTYIFYRYPEDQEIGYAFVDLDVEENYDEVLVTAKLKDAYNDGDVSNEKLIRLELIDPENLTLREDWL